MESRSREGARLLVIGYGNELRRDDGVGAKVAGAVAEWKLRGIEGIVCQQLTPELTDPIASAAHVVFVDAALGDGGPVQCRKIEPDENSQVLTHTTDPSSLVALARQAFGRCPPATWLTIPIQDIDFGEELSAVADEGLQIALEKIRSLADAICG